MDIESSGKLLILCFMGETGNFVSYATLIDLFNCHNKEEIDFSE